jgi:hypothetical protein
MPKTQSGLCACLVGWVIFIRDSIGGAGRC